MISVFDKYSEPIAAIGYALREMILTQLPGCEEQIDVPGNLLGYSYGKGYKNTICTIIASKQMMKLGFYKGSELPDPSNMLKGSGKVHKYIEIKQLDDIEHPAVKMMLSDAFNAWKERSEG